MDQDEENANLSGMEGLDDHNEDTYPKWDVDILHGEYRFPEQKFKDFFKDIFAVFKDIFSVVPGVSQ